MSVYLCFLVIVAVAVVCGFVVGVAVAVVVIVTAAAVVGCWLLLLLLLLLVVLMLSGIIAFVKLCIVSCSSAFCPMVPFVLQNTTLLFLLITTASSSAAFVDLQYGRLHSLGSCITWLTTRFAAYSCFHHLA